MLSGISERMIVKHYEDNYGNAVRALNADRRELAALDVSPSPYRLRGLRREESPRVLARGPRPTPNPAGLLPALCP